MNSIDDNSKDRLHDVFFYGLYMDPDVLKQKGVEPRNPRRAVLSNFVLKIGNKAALLRAKGQSSHGIVYALTRAEFNQLYSGPELAGYQPEAVSVKVGDQEIAALCFNLLEPLDSGVTNLEYSKKLKQAMNKLGVPVTFA